MESQERLEAVFDTAYGYAENQSDYNKLDGIFFVGDFTQGGQESQQKNFFNTVNEKTKGDTVVRAVMGNHEYYATGEYSEESMAQAPLNFLEWSGYEDDDMHLNIDGFHFILLSMDKYGTYTGTANEYLSDTKLAWLKEQLDDALADDPTGEKPIFVMQHIGPKDTMLGSGNADTKLRELLNDYPNVVDFSGHTHRPITDPRSIWQGEFTALQTGSLCYLGLMLVGHPTYNSSGLRETADGNWEASSSENGPRNGNMYYVCEIDANNVMRIIVYDLINDEIFGEPYYLDSFGDPTGFDYTNDRQQSSQAPTFAAGDKITVLQNDYNEVKITYPQATCKDYVQNYRVDVYLKQALSKS